MAGRAAPHRSSDAHAGIHRWQRNQRCTVHADLVPARSAWDGGLTVPDVLTMFTEVRRRPDLDWPFEIASVNRWDGNGSHHPPR